MIATNIGEMIAAKAITIVTVPELIFIVRSPSFQCNYIAERRKTQTRKDTLEREGSMKKKIAQWWTEKTSVEKSVTSLTFIVLIVIIQVLTLSVRLSETISLLLQVTKAVQQASFQQL